MGFPIRKSADQSFFAAPHGLSQRSTSFIASQRQGIHRMPLRHLIALIINAHPLGVDAVAPSRDRMRSIPVPGTATARTLIRKTSLSSDRSDGVRSSSRHAPRSTACAATGARRKRNRRDAHPACSARCPSRRMLGAILPLHDVRYQYLSVLTPRLPAGCGLAAGPTHDARKHLSRTSNCHGRAIDPTGGARRDRTDDLLLAKQALSQLSYGP